MVSLGCSDDAASSPPGDGGAETGGAAGAQTGGTGASGGQGAAGGSDTGGIGGTGGTGGGTGGVGGSSEVPIGDGFVLISQSSGSWQSYADFESWPTAPRCASRNVGACRLETCIGLTPASPRPHAGVITVTSGSLTRTLQPGINGDYQSVSEVGELWSPGQQVQITLAGAEAPAASMTLTGPATFTLTDPPVTSTLPIIRTQTLVVRWSGGTGGSVVAALTGTPLGGAAGDSLQVKCSFDAAAGEGSIPATALGELDPSSQGSFHAFVEDYRITMVQGWQLRFSARRDSVLAQVVYQ